MKINWYSILKKSTIGLLLFYVGMVFSQVTTPECPVCEDPVNVWYKVSTFEPDRGKIVRLDMRKGQAFTDHQYIYISVKDLDTGELVYIAFPNGGDWVAEPKKDPFLEALDEEFKNLEDYLRSKESQEIKKKQ
jgi:hypothetical protein